jgi:hypothetical protein
MSGAGHEPALAGLHFGQLALSLFRAQLFFRQMAAQAGQFTVVLIGKVYCTGVAAAWARVCQRAGSGNAAKRMFFDLNLAITHEAPPLARGFHGLAGRGTPPRGLAKPFERVEHTGFLEPVLMLLIRCRRRKKRRSIHQSEYHVLILLRYMKQKCPTSSPLPFPVSI